MDGGNHYVAQVKKNQKTLYEDIRQVAVGQPADSVSVASEKAKGMLVTRETSVFEVGDRKKAGGWAALKTYIEVKRLVVGKGADKTETAYFISDLDLGAAGFNKGIREHWGIENRLHWVKDVTHGEDKNKIRTDNGPMNASVFSTIAINIHRKHGNGSVSRAQMEYAAHLIDHINVIRT